MNFKKSICLFSLFLIASCGTDQMKSIQLNQEFSLGIGETGIMSTPSLSVKIEIVNDGRCPADLHCVWQGSADVIFSFESESSGLIIDTLRTYDRTSINIDNFIIKLINLTPLPKVGEKQKNKTTKMLITNN